MLALTLRKCYDFNYFLTINNIWIKSKNVILIDEKGRKGAEGLNIAFLHPKSTFGVLTELCEKPE